MKKNNKHLSIIALGDHGSGKSTLLGRLLHEVEKKRDPGSESQNTPSGKNLNFAKLMEFPKNPKKGTKPESISHKCMRLGQWSCSLIDVYKFRNYNRHLLSALSQAEAALLVVSAQKSASDRALAKHSVTVEHALAAFTVGIRRVIVAVNKMDATRKCAWNNQRFSTIKSQMTHLLEKIGFNFKQIVFVPVSGRTGDNLVGQSENMRWFFGGTLLDAIQNLPRNYSSHKRPLRITINKTLKKWGGACVAIGKVQSGQMDVGAKVLLPSGLISEVASIQMFGENRATAREGDNIGFVLKQIDQKLIKSGDVVSCTQFPAKEAKSFVIQILVTGDVGRMKKGFRPVINCHSANVSCTFQEILNIIDTKTGTIIRAHPDRLEKGNCARVLLVPSKRICVEKCRDFPRLGKVFIRENKQIVAVGVVTRVNY